MQLSAQQIAKFAKYGKYLGVKTSGLNIEIVSDIARLSGKDPNVTSDQFKEVVDTLRSNDVEGFADILGKPELLPKVLAIFKDKPQGNDDNLFCCRHCGEYSNPQD